MKRQSGQVLVIVAVWLIALIGSAALILLAGSVEWQRNQLQQIADQAALDAALEIGVGCSAGSSTAVLTEADNFVATQRVRTGSLTVGAGTCAGGYTGTDTFAGALSETIHYPYRLHQQQVEVILTETLPISFGNAMGASNTIVTRRAVAQQLNGSTAAITAGRLSCTGGQFNVTGGIVASNAIALSGGCAVYAHNRFDAASSTYSDLANVSVYANGQTWVNGGGVCEPGANDGSSRAICADGYELSGHNSTSCGTSGTSAFLSAGDAAVNPNPCAAGKAPQPVAPVSILLPPEPNRDPAALGTLPGSTPCSPGTVYPNLVVDGATVGTAEVGTPAPVKDASNFYHFKPSCYGYLNPGALPSGGGGGPIALVQTGPEVAGTQSVRPTLTSPSAAGNLLVVTVRMTPTNLASTPPGGWFNAVGVNEPNTGRSEIFYYPNNPGGISAATFSFNPSFNGGLAQMSEWRGASALDQTGTFTWSQQQGQTFTVSTSSATTAAGELAITANAFFPTGGGNVYTRGAGWSSLLADLTFGYASDYRLNVPIGVAGETVSYSSDTTWAMTIATFKSGGGAVAGAVLDPGFYYFNGSGFGGGGGICLNGTTLLARDVTLEFVNQAGLSTGSCAPGGGGGCAVATCQLGSAPCSIAACPPNSAADSASGGYTWFAAPCNTAPPGDASCPGSAWCPVGDRACWNTLVWAPASSTGQIAISGAAARHWLLGSVFWPGTCTDTVNGTSTLAGTIACGTLTVSAAAGAGTAVGSDYGVSTALVEAVLIE